jgi:hypothetical protein
MNVTVTITQQFNYTSYSIETKPLLKEEAIEIYLDRFQT